MSSQTTTSSSIATSVEPFAARVGPVHFCGRALVSCQVATGRGMVEAGLHLMLEQGYHHTGIQDVLQAAGVPKGSFYYYFPSKEAFAREVIAQFAAAYLAETIRGGLQAIPRGQGEAAAALGLSWVKTTFLIVLPQALRHVIPGLVNSFIALFKDTSLVSIVALFDLLGSLRASFSDPNWATPTTLFTGFAFTGIIYFAFCFGMSRYSLFVENRLNAHRRN